MKSTVMILEMDPFPAPLEAATRLWGAMQLPSVDLADIPHCCGRQLALNRLWLRRCAVGKPAPGESWSPFEAFHLIDEEIERMREELAPTWPPRYVDLDLILAGCKCDDCLTCRPPLCQQCGLPRWGQSCDQAAATAPPARSWSRPVAVSGFSGGSVTVN